jgi:hypothetical protein
VSPAVFTSDPVPAPAPLPPQAPIACPLQHRFAPGIYLREIHMPAGVFVVGHEHATEHFNIVLQGRAQVRLIRADGESESVGMIEAPATFISEAGVRKVLIIEEDMIWQTVHANPDDERDIAKLEERYVRLSPELLAAKGSLDLETFRLSQPQLPHPVIP